MDPVNTNQNPVAAGSHFPQPEAPKSSTGSVAGIVIIVALLIAGGLYFWGAKLNHEQASQEVPYIPSDDSMQTDTQQPTTLQSDTSAGLPPQGSSDDVNSIQSDFNAMDLNQMNSQNSAEMSNI